MMFYQWIEESGLINQKAYTQLRIEERLFKNFKAGTGNRTFNNMSWSVYLIGTPAAIVQALKKESERLTGASKTEFDNVLPGLLKIVEGNYNTHPNAYASAFKLAANGHKDGSYGSCNVVFENTGCVLVTETVPDQVKEEIQPAAQG